MWIGLNNISMKSILHEHMSIEGYFLNLFESKTRLPITVKCLNGWDWAKWHYAYENETVVEVTKGREQRTALMFDVMCKSYSKYSSGLDRSQTGARPSPPSVCFDLYLRCARKATGDTS
jgi:hypothetical protein